MYNEIIIDHFSNPRNVGELGNYDFILETGNPVCDDRMKIWILLNNENSRIKEVKFKAFGCATSLATASIFSEFIKDNDIEILGSVKNIDEMLGDLEPSQQHCYAILKDLFANINKQLEPYLLTVA